MSNRLNGGIQHGILYMISDTNGARTTEIMNCFPTIFSSSTLTAMHRKGLIVHTTEKTTSPWVLTAAGRTLLNSLIRYTPAIYWEASWGRGTRPDYANVNHYAWQQSAYMSEKHYGWGC